MTRLISFLIFLCLAACDPYDLGFKKNPAYVLKEAMKAISNLDRESFLEVSAKEVLCIYANDRGLSFLKEKIDFSESEVNLVPKILSQKSYDKPVFVGYWSYYHERYEIDVQSKQSQQQILRTIIDCHYGFEGIKDQSMANLLPYQYKKKECRAIKLIPTKFVPLPLPQKCLKLKVDL
jgi:hypothetical protein